MEPQIDYELNTEVLWEGQEARVIGRQNIYHTPAFGEMVYLDEFPRLLRVDYTIEPLNLPPGFGAPIVVSHYALKPITPWHVFDSEEIKYTFHSRRSRVYIENNFIGFASDVKLEIR